MVRVFVYGSLKTGFSNTFLLNGQRFLGTGRSAPRYRMFDCGGFPGLVPAARGGKSGAGTAIEGEIWEVDAECLARLDDLEGVDEGYYRRDTLGLAPEDARHAPVAAYFWEGRTAGLRELAGGVWTREDEESGAR